MNRLTKIVLGLIVVAVTNNVYILNEETLVLIAFTAFIIFAYNKIGDSVGTSMDDQISKIHTEFEALSEAREVRLKLLISSYKTVEVAIKEMVSVSMYIETLINSLVNKNKIIISNEIKKEINNKLETILNTEGTFLRSIQYNAVPLVKENALSKINVKKDSKRIKKEALLKLDKITKDKTNVLSKGKLSSLNDNTNISLNVLNLINLYK